MIFHYYNNSSTFIIFSKCYKSKIIKVEKAKLLIFLLKIIKWVSLPIKKGIRRLD
jgi:hypothetical protein